MSHTPRDNAGCVLTRAWARIGFGANQASSFLLTAITSVRLNEV
jgi:hypothetical protein